MIQSGFPKKITVLANNMKLVFSFFVLATVASTERACDNGWLPYRNHCYWFSSNPATFHYAVDTCSERGSNLIEIRDAAEDKWVLLQSLIRGFTQVWIGLTDIVDEDIYVYPSDGAKSVYLNWNIGQPSGGKGENCAAIRTPFQKWHDFPCNNNVSYICKKPAKHFV